LATSQARNLLAAIRAHKGPILLHAAGLHVKADATTETVAEFMAKKLEDLQNCAVIYWYGQDARPERIRPTAAAIGSVYVVMFNGGTPIKGKDSGRPQYFNSSRVRSQGFWTPLPGAMKPVTGGMNAKAAALVIDELYEAGGETIDLGEYTAKSHQRASIWWTDKSHPQRGSRVKNLVAVLSSVNQVVPEESYAPPLAEINWQPTM
jgi:hypothetical protein